MNRIEFKGLKDESEGRIEVLSPRKTVEFTIEEYNELIDSPWALIDVYLKEGIRTTLWRHKETGELNERIGLHPPDERLVIFKAEETDRDCTRGSSDKKAKKEGGEKWLRKKNI